MAGRSSHPLVEAAGSRLQGATCTIPSLSSGEEHHRTHTHTHTTTHPTRVKTHTHTEREKVNKQQITLHRLLQMASGNIPPRSVPALVFSWARAPSASRPGLEPAILYIGLAYKERTVPGGVGLTMAARASASGGREHAVSICGGLRRPRRGAGL